MLRCIADMMTMRVSAITKKSYYRNPAKMNDMLLLGSINCFADDGAVHGGYHGCYLAGRTKT